MTIVPAVLTAKPSETGDEAKGIEERLIFDKNKVVNPKLTVAMNDESLCGYIIKDQESPIKKLSNNVAFPDGMTFTYSSNRPSVVAVNDNVITTVAPGVATITATATYNGKTVSTDFVVYVESTPYIDGITVDGTPVANFKDDRLSYAVELAAGTTTVPQVAAVTDNTDLTVQVTQATQLPGVATVSVTNTYLNQTVVYRVGFGMKPVTTDLKEGKEAALSKGWSVKNGNDNASFSDTGGLIIATEQGAFSSAAAQPQNLYMDNYIGFTVGDRAIYLNTEKDGVVTALGSVKTDIADVNYYRIQKSGDDYTFFYSADGKNFQEAGTATDTGLEDVDLAFDAYCTRSLSGKNMRVAVLSGKGGTGKTFVSVNLAAAAKKAFYIDCDVEEPNGRLYWKPKVEKETPVSVLVPVFDDQKCSGCRTW